MIFVGFLDAVDKITLLVDKNMQIDSEFYLEYDNRKLVLQYLEKIEEYNWYKYILKVDEVLDMTKYIYIKNGHNRAILFSGGFVRDPRFDELYTYDGPLGFIYTTNETTFRIWSPVARIIELELITNKGKLIIKRLEHRGNGLWETTILGDLEKAKYRYRVKIFDEYKVINDPYGVAADANGKYNYVIDSRKLYEFKYKKPDFSGRITDSIVYEASVRDLTSQLDCKNKMTFKGLCQKLTTIKGNDAGLDYISDLGVTHLQLMPIFDFYGVDDKDITRFYNWGYNPTEYFVPKGAYSTNPNDPYARINELRELVDYCHAYGLLVVMDVVYNHVYDMLTFPFDNLVPGYYYRDQNGYPTNVSGCGNDLATERKMCSKFIIDNLCYMTKTYNFSGYRFDLMGLLDIPTLKQAVKILKLIDPCIILYGEGWNMPNTLPENMRPHSLNYRYIHEYAFFNDRYRNYLKGSGWEKTTGYILTGNKNDEELFHLLTGSCLDYFMFDMPSQTINYIECHDNYTVYDHLKEFAVEAKTEDIREACKLGLQIVLISQGVPFIHAGQEFYRTKLGTENSYKDDDSINGIDWTLKDKHYHSVKAISDLIYIRKSYPLLRLSSTREIINAARINTYHTNSKHFCYELEDETMQLLILIKTTNDKFEINDLDHFLIYDSNCLCEKYVKKYIFKYKGVYIFRKDKKKNDNLCDS